MFIFNLKMLINIFDPNPCPYNRYDLGNYKIKKVGYFKSNLISVSASPKLSSKCICFFKNF